MKKKEGKKMKKDDEVKQQMVWHGNVNKCFSKLLWQRKYEFFPNL